MKELFEELLIYTDYKSDEALDAASELDEPCENGERRKAMRFARALTGLAAKYGFKGNLWKCAVSRFIAMSENTFSIKTEMRGAGGEAESADSESSLMIRECGILRKIFNYDFGFLASDFQSLFNFDDTLGAKKAGLTGEGAAIEALTRELTAAGDDISFYEAVRSFYMKSGAGTIGLNKAFVVSESGGIPKLAPIHEISDVTFDDIVGYEIQKEMLTANTEAFIKGLPANNVLLYGDSGTGKSTSVRALMNKYASAGLRTVQVYRHQMQHLPRIIEEIRSRNYRFIIYMDDLSFEDFETEYKYLKAVIEGGLEPRPKNVLIYATSNRRHFIKETHGDRRDEEFDGEIFKSDTLEEKRSLADRFGVQIYYGKPSREEYHEIVSAIASREGVSISEDELRAEATKWEIRHGGVSGRSARQFIDYIKGTEVLKS